METEKNIHIEDYLYLVRNEVIHHFTPRTNRTGMEYDDLYQTGCLALCNAVTTYCTNKGASFVTYATVLIHNQLCNYCIQINRIKDSPTDEVELQQLVEPEFDEILLILKKLQNQYKGIAGKGITALLLKDNGYKIKEIAAIFHVKPNHIAAWITRAIQKLRTNSEIIALSKGA